MSPIANNALCLQLAKNPFDEYFAVGLNVYNPHDSPSP